VFAGAAREAVFSVPAVSRRVNAEFVPLAVRATLANGAASDDAESRVYGRIGRSQAAPQGICVLDSDGRVLDWVLTFESDQAVLDFLDYALKRYAEAKAPAPTRRYQTFPRAAMEDFRDDDDAAIAGPHAKDERCAGAGAAKAKGARGSLSMRLVGRALDADGKPLADTVKQENYAEDQFAIPARLQESLAKAIAEGGDRARVPDALARLLVTHAHLGHLDVQPLSNPGGGGSDLRKCEFWIAKGGRVTGESDVYIQKMANGGPGDMHEVKLAWDGFIVLEGRRVTQLVVTARGRERLKFGTRATRRPEPEVARLPGGRRIDIDCDVRYGLIGTPLPDAEATDAPEAPPESLQLKMKGLGDAVQAWARGGGDMQELQPELEKLHGLLEKRDFGAAEKQVDAIRERIK